MVATQQGAAQRVITSTILTFMDLNVLYKPWSGDDQVQSGTGAVRPRVSRVANFKIENVQQIIQ